MTESVVAGDEESTSMPLPQTVVNEEDIPHPCGFRLLIALPEISDKYNNFLFKPEKLVQQEEVASVIGLVLDMGPEAYQDKERFKAPWCKIGDYILIRPYTGTRFRVHGKEFRLINDDSVEAVIKGDPRAFTRA